MLPNFRICAAEMPFPAFMHCQSTSTYLYAWDAIHDPCATQADQTFSHAPADATPGQWGASTMYASATESFPSSSMHEDSIPPSTGYGDVPLHGDFIPPSASYNDVTLHGSGRHVSVSPPPPPSSHLMDVNLSSPYPRPPSSSHLMDVSLYSPPPLGQRPHIPVDPLRNADGPPPPGWAPPAQRQQEEWPLSSGEMFPGQQAAASHPSSHYPSIPPQGSHHESQQPAPSPTPQWEYIAPPSAPSAPPPSHGPTAPPPPWPSAGASRQPQGGFEDGAGPTYIVLVGSPVLVIGPAPLPGMNKCGGGFDDGADPALLLLVADRHGRSASPGRWPGAHPGVRCSFRPESPFAPPRPHRSPSMLFHPKGVDGSHV